VNTTADETDPYISLDGRRLAFVRDSSGTSRILLYDTQSETFIALPGLASASSNDTAPALDETGSRIAFVSDRNGNPDVFVYDVPSHTLMGIAPGISPNDDVEPSISGNAMWLCFASNRPGGSGGYDLHLVDLGTWQLVAIAGNTTSDDRDPSISYDGTHVHFTSNRAGGAGATDLWLLDRTTGGVSAVAGQNSPVDDVDPVIVWR